MADITLRLIWYKLNETVSKMAEAGADAQSWFNWEEHFLDVLLLFWISLGLIIVGASNSLLQLLGPIQKPRISWDRSRDGFSSSKAVQGPHKPESTFWLNSALNWAYLHYNFVPEFVDAWVHSLNEQVSKLGGPVHIKFEKVEPGSLPPKFGDVQYDAGPEDVYILECIVDSRDLSFAIFASQQTHEGVKLTNMIVTVLKLKGHLKIRCYLDGKDMMAEASFHGRPDVKVEGKPVNQYTDPSDLVDIGVVQEVVRNAICLTSTKFNLSRWIIGHGILERLPLQRTHSSEIPPQSAEALVVPGSAPSSPQEVTPQSVSQQFAMPQFSAPQHQSLPPQRTPSPINKPQVFEAIEVQQAQQQHSAFHVPTLSTPPKPQQQRIPYTGPTDKRLLVKVIKASGLKQNEGPVDPYCVSYVDTPPQSEVTSVVRNSFNPFWDEQFYFDLSRDSRDLRFEILDKRRAPNENFLGEAVVDCQDLKHNPSSRQIIPLQGRLGAGEFVAGSITVEFLCMDPSEDTMSPRRTIETSKSVTPGGTLVTETTTTTQKPQNQTYNTNIGGSPSYIEKRDYEYDPAEAQGGSSEVIHINGVESVAETAIRELSKQSKLGKKTPSKTTTLIITGVKREPVVPKIQTVESTHTDEEMEAKSATNTMSSPEITYSQPKDDIDLHKQQQTMETPNLKKSKSLGGSLKKLFRRSRKRSRSIGRGEQSRESSISRQSRHASQGPSREGSLTRSQQSAPQQHDTVIL